MIYGGWDAGIILRFLVPRIINRYNNYIKKHEEGNGTSTEAMNLPSEEEVYELSDAFINNNIDVIKEKWYIIEKLAESGIGCTL
jgi:hypothetical protein